MRLYGARGCGSAITEAMLAIAGRPYEFVDVGGFEQPGPARDALALINPLVQVPALVLDDGTILTETAAIALFLADGHLGLAPPCCTPERTRFYRLLIWLVANVYPTFTYGDVPERWVDTAPAELDASTGRRREALYRWLDGELCEPFALGPDLSAVDIFLAVMVAWRPWRPWFERHAPRIARIAERTGALPPIAAVLRENGWPPASLGTNSLNET